MKYLIFVLLIFSSSFHAKADPESKQFVNAIIALGHPTGLSRDQLNSVLRFSNEKLKELHTEFSRDDSMLEMVFYLSALNCAFEPDMGSRHFALYHYRCGKMPLDTFAAINLPHNYRVLRFVREEHRHRAINYLEQYSSSFEQANCEESICISDVIIKKNRKLIEYLKQGGVKF